MFVQKYRLVPQPTAVFKMLAKYNNNNKKTIGRNFFRNTTSHQTSNLSCGSKRLFSWQFLKYCNNETTGPVVYTCRFQKKDLKMSHRKVMRKKEHKGVLIGLSIR